MSRRRNQVAVAIAVVVAACAVATAAGQQQATVGYPHKEAGRWGKQGVGNGQFQNGAFLAIDASGKVYVADTDSRRVQVFSAKGGFVRAVELDAEATVPDVAVGSDGTAFATQGTASAVGQITAGGQAGESIATPTGSEGIGVDAQGSIFVSGNTNGKSTVVRYDPSASGWAAAKQWGGLQDAGDVEVAADGTVYVADRRGSPPTVKRFDRNGKLLKTIKTQLPATAGAGAQLGIAVDLDCNLWMTNIPQRNLVKVSPTGTIMATAASADLIALDVAVGPTGDLYAFDSGTKVIIRFAEDRSKPLPASVGGAVVAAKGNGFVARLRYIASGIACPAQIDAVASLAGGAVVGKAAVKVAAGRPTMLEIPLSRAQLRRAAGTSVEAAFRIALKTNGRGTTQTANVRIAVPASAR